MTAVLQFLPTDSQFLLSPFSWFAKMRREAAVFYDTEHQCWMVFRYDDVARVLSEWKTFSSKVPQPPEQKDFTQSLVSTDPPKHKSLRSIVQSIQYAQTTALPAFGQYTRQSKSSPYATSFRICACAASRKAITCSRFTVGNPSRKSSIDSPAFK